MRKLDVFWKKLKELDKKKTVLDKQIKPLEKRRNRLEMRIHNLWMKNFGIADGEAVTTDGLIKAIVKTVRKMDRQVSK